jgi:CheY-like chemotaxis protein
LTGPAQHADGQVAQGRHDLRGGPGAELGGDLGEGDVPHVVQPVLDAPVRPCAWSRVRSTASVCSPQLKHDRPATELLMLTSSQDDQHLLAAIFAGALAYLPKTAGVDQVVTRSAPPPAAVRRRG